MHVGEFSHVCTFGDALPAQEQDASVRSPHAGERRQENVRGGIPEGVGRLGRRGPGGPDLGGGRRGAAAWAGRGLAGGGGLRPPLSLMPGLKFPFYPPW